MFDFRPYSRTRLTALLAAAGIAALQFSAPAEARHFGGGGGWHRGAWFAGGLVVGAAIAPRYVAAAPYYYPPVTYSPPPVVYSQPPVIYTQPRVVYSPPSQYVQPPPYVAVAPAPQSQALSVEDRLHRLKSLCDQRLLTAHECQVRREQILREL